MGCEGEDRRGMSSGDMSAAAEAVGGGHGALGRNGLWTWRHGVLGVKVGALHPFYWAWRRGDYWPTMQHILRRVVGGS
jgi:hypothetical protein